MPSPMLTRYAPIMEHEKLKMILIQGPEGITETVAAELVDEDTYELIENPIFACKINYGTTVKALPNDKGELVLTKVVTASKFVTRQFIVSTYVKDSNFSEKIGKPIIEAGGTWEAVFGGVVFIHIPKISNFDLDKLFKVNNYNATEIVEDKSTGS